MIEQMAESEQASTTRQDTKKKDFRLVAGLQTNKSKKKCVLWSSMRESRDWSVPRSRKEWTKAWRGASELCELSHKLFWLRALSHKFCCTFLLVEPEIAQWLFFFSPSFRNEIMVCEVGYQTNPNRRGGCKRLVKSVRTRARSNQDACGC